MSRTATRAVLIIVGLGLGVAWLGEGIARRRLERRYQAAIEARRQLELQMGELQADRERLSATLSVEQQRVRQLSEALSGRGQELEEAKVRLMQEEGMIRELQEKLVTIQRQFDLLQGELSMALQERTSGPPLEADRAIRLEKVLVAPPASSGLGLQGRVVSVHPEWHFVVIDLGWDLVRIGDVVSIYRNEQLVGKARVERVQDQVSAASLLPEWIEAEIQINDVVRAL